MIVKNIVSLIINSIKHIKSMKRKEKAYGQMTAEELAALSDEELSDALDAVLLFKEDSSRISEYNTVQLTAIAVRRFDSEVQNGGLCQFFVNSSGDYAPYVIESLQRIGAEKAAGLLQSFVRKHQIDVQDISSFKISSLKDFEAQCARYPFDDFDDAYYENYEQENIEDLLLCYVRKNLAEVL